MSQGVGGPYRTPDVAVIGAGAIGASVARHLALGGTRVVVLEKEPAPARHQSGRNSGVIHAGYNLKPGSLKARYCAEGSRRLRGYCREHAIPMDQNGILVVARSDAERSTLAELHRRARANGVAADLVSGDDIPRLEPHARGIAALHAPEGASFDAAAYVAALLSESARLGAEVRYGVRVVDVREGASAVTLRTTAGALTAGAVVNCAGLHADRLAGPVARDVRVVPFRGYYAELVPERRGLVRAHVYAVPDLDFPFLGVHLSRRTDGRVIIGPGAMLAFGREAYRLAQLHPRDLWDMVCWPGFRRLVLRRPFRALARRELMKSVWLGAIAREARLLVPALATRDLVRSYAGNRAQLVTRDGQLVDDLLVAETARTVHVLNAVSPGLTCSLPFGDHVAARALTKLDAPSGERAVERPAEASR